MGVIYNYNGIGSAHMQEHGMASSRVTLVEWVGVTSWDCSSGRGGKVCIEMARERVTWLVILLHGVSILGTYPQKSCSSM